MLKKKYHMIVDFCSKSLLFKKIERIPKNYRYILFLFVVFILIITVRSLFITGKNFNKIETKDALVTIIDSKRQMHEFFISLSAKAESEKKIEIKSIISGRVINFPFKKGSLVDKGQVITEIANNDFYNIIEGAENRLFEAQKRNSKIEIDQARVAYEKAKNYSRVSVVRAPFTGFIDDIFLKHGDYVHPGDAIMTLYQNDNMILTTYLPEKYYAQVNLDSKVKVFLSNNKEIEGKVIFISKILDQETKTFKLEILVSNKENMIADSMFVNVLLCVKNSYAHKIPGSALNIGLNGKIGVKVVNNNNQVEFIEANILDDTEDEMWIETTQEDDLQIITKGHFFAKEGHKVKTHKLPL